jgi:hypothetical protein
MKGENRKGSRREAAILRRLKNLEQYAASNNVEKARKAYRDIFCTSSKLNKETPSEARACLNKLGLKEEDIITSKPKVEANPEELPEEGLGA